MIAVMSFIDQGLRERHCAAIPRHGLNAGTVPCRIGAANPGDALPRTPWMHQHGAPRRPRRPIRAHTMAFDPRTIDELARRLAGSVPESVVALRRDLEQNFKSVLQAQLARLDLVTREEFDVQSAVLRRTREKLESLEKRIAAIEGEQA
jgi:BMFP domain-containing protein YqiC